MRKVVALAMSVLLYFSSSSVWQSSSKPGSVSVVPLAIKIERVDSTGTLNQIQSDTYDPFSLTNANNPYVDGVDGSANLDGGGNLVFSLPTSGRKIFFDYSRAYSPYGHTPPAAGVHSGPYLSTIPKDGDPNPYIPIQNLGVNGNPSAECLQLSWKFSDVIVANLIWRNSFHRGISNTPGSFASYAVVTRIDSNTWEVEPKTSPCNTGLPTIANVLDESTKGNTVTSDDGYYFMPFKLTLKKK